MAAGDVKDGQGEGRGTGDDDVDRADLDAMEKLTTLVVGGVVYLTIVLRYLRRGFGDATDSYERDEVEEDDKGKDDNPGDDDCEDVGGRVVPVATGREDIEGELHCDDDQCNEDGQSHHHAGLGRP